MSATNLGNWLATNFNNMYGANAGANNLAGKTNAQVAAFYQSLYASSSKKLDAQTMAVALAVYVTKSSLAGSVATSYGFGVSTIGLGAATFNVESSGAAFGVDDYEIMTIMELLLRTNARARKGILWNVDADSTVDSPEKVLRNQAYMLFEDINTT